ncbi:MAG: trypsin-like peptidase domain-containing protein [Candidatus Eremiobacteraeota bacterium]|nr:trypsin-like peptidase domain-containing protein [Candidatus Eremiobacteraeota bacterium]MBV8497699.1 trypsin-like peptidase domain-containing protein [Candidatus Eremiobacteraeota bacterium]
MVKNRILPTLIVGLVGAVIGSFLMMLYASSHFGGATGPDRTPPAVAAVPLSGVSDQDRIVSAVKRTKSSVVAITEQVNGQQVIPADPFFQQFFGGQGPGIVQPYRGEASGSGFVIDGRGDIVTNAHVLQPPNGGHVTKLTVVFANGDHVPAHVIAYNLAADVGILRVDGYSKLPPPLQLADSSRLEQGQWAIAIGEPLQLQQTVTVGVVSGFNRQEPIPTENGGEIDFKGLLQTSAPINPGNSGGPLIDIDGQVIGMNQSTVKSAYAQGIGFAIPSNTVRSVVASLEKNPGAHQGTDTGFLGIYMADLTAGVKNQIGYTGNGGIAVQQVFSGSPADQAGIQPGDVILQADGKSFDSVKSLHDYIGGKKPGDTIRLNVWSQGLKKFVAIKLGETPAEQPLSVQQQQQQQPEEQQP